MRRGGRNAEEGDGTWKGDGTQRSGDGMRRGAERGGGRNAEQGEGTWRRGTEHRGGGRNAEEGRNAAGRIAIAAVASAIATVCPDSPL